MPVVSVSRSTQSDLCISDLAHLTASCLSFAFVLLSGSIIELDIYFSSEFCGKNYWRLVYFNKASQVQVARLLLVVRYAGSTGIRIASKLDFI